MARSPRKASKKTEPKIKQLSNPFSTGGGGVNFETRVQASFAVLMLAGGTSPCTRLWPIKAVHLQAKRLGLETDDVVVEAHEPLGQRRSRLLGQIKHDVAFTPSNKTFGEVIFAAWTDFIKSVDGDAFALITGPLSGNDLELRAVLEWARTSATAEDFYSKVGQANFSSANKQAKLKAVLHHLKVANKKVAVPEELAWKFLRSFHILQYDLDIAGGVNRAFLTCIISQFGVSGADGTWAQLIEAVSDINQNAGSVTIGTLPKDLVELFQARQEVTIARDLLPPQSSPSTIRATNANNPVVAIAQLIGAWTEASQSDRAYVSALAEEPYNEFVRKLTVELNAPASVLRHRNGVWSVLDREECWDVGGSYVFDRHLDLVQTHAARALSEDDRSLRAAGGVPETDKPETYSRQLRSSFADTLALIATRPAALRNCRQETVNRVPRVVVAQCLESGDWTRIASLDRDLAVLAEAAPEEFLTALERKSRDGDAIRDLFAVEHRGGVFGRTHSTGLLWGLENLAWSKEFLPRVTLVLGRLDELDPGGQWTNRPSETLKSIFLPWHPQTSASTAVRAAALKALGREHPQIAWKVYVAALPGVTQSTSGTHRPKWRDFGVVEAPITRHQYFDEINIYTENLLSLASSRPENLTDLVEHLPNLPPDAITKAVSLIEANIGALRESGRDQTVWSALEETARKHKAFAHADWAMSPTSIKEIEVLASQLRPTNPAIRYKELFGLSDPLTYDRESTWRERQDKIESLREQALAEVWAESGLSGVISFAMSVQKPRAVGAALAKLDHASVPAAELQRWAESDEEYLRDLVSGYAAQNYVARDGEWLERLGLGDWTADGAAKVLSALPFSRSTWDIVERLLAKNQSLYWTSVDIGFVENQRDTHYVVKNLLMNGRPGSAINILHSFMFRFGKLDTRDAVKALLSLAKAGTKFMATDSYEVEALIKHLQETGKVKTGDLERIEWAFLDLLVQPGRETSPKTLEHRLADDPVFYLEVLGTVYRPKGATAREPTERERRLASASHRLLLSWRTPPGQKIDGSFSEASFRTWFEQFVRDAETMGYLEIGLSKLGQVLIHVPGDQSGFWINLEVASTLNSNQFEQLRSGYRTGLFNARGAHWIDPSGEPERKLADQYRRQAEEADLQGFVRLAATIRDLAKDYEFQAETVAERFDLNSEE